MKLGWGQPRWLRRGVKRFLRSWPSTCDASNALTAAASCRSSTLPAHLPPLQLAYVREWQAELCAVYRAAEAAGFDDASVAEVEATTDRMTKMWWHVGQLQPAWLSALAFRAYPENSGQASGDQAAAGDLLCFVRQSVAGHLIDKRRPLLPPHLPCRNARHHETALFRPSVPPCSCRCGGRLLLRCCLSWTRGAERWW